MTPKRLILPSAFAAAFVSFNLLAGGSRPSPAPLAVGGAPEPGTFPDDWISGTDCATEPDFQIHAYNQDLYIIRQSRCDIFESPFIYLIFGGERALMLDTGAASNPLLEVLVDKIAARWKRANGILGDYEIIVAHTHGHGDHTANDSSFEGDSDYTYVGISPPEVHGFWGFTDWPNGQTEFDLGNRVLDVLATPGHQKESITVYDRRTQLLLTGDIVYPGHLFVFVPDQWPVFIESITKLVTFAQQNPVTWVVGCHVEISNTPGDWYPYGVASQPDEHPLQLDPSVLLDIQAAALAQGLDGDNAFCEAHDEFVLHPVYKCGL